MGMSKNLYVPFRALGLVCDGLEGTGCTPYIYKRGLSVTITTPVDGARALHCYNMNLRLRAVSRPLPSGWIEDGSQITACVVHDDFTYAAFEKSIVLYDKMRPYTVWKVHEDPVSHALTIGHILVTVSAIERRVLAFRLPEYYKDKPPKAPEIVSDVTLPIDFLVSAVCHPQTYVNKILLGARDGRCLLLNLRSRSIIHTFPSFGSSVTVLTPTPALDVVAVGLADGRVVLHNFKYDETIATYQHGAGDEFDELDDPNNVENENVNPIRAITFRTDKTETMVVSDKIGNLILWDLNEKRMLSAALRVHRGGAALAQFLEGEPILVTAGLADNSIKVHIFDGNEGEARMLRSREGHKLPPTCVRFCGRSTNMLVSVGLDRELRLVSSVQDNKNKTFSQASLSKMSAKKRKRIRASRGVEVGAKDSNVAGLLPIVRALATSTSKLRDEEFANIITAHANLEHVYTWRSRNASVFQHVLLPKPRPGKLKLMLDVLREGKKDKKKKTTPSRKQINAENREACAVAISPCGNFGIVGSVDGRVHMYNLQSGAHVGAFEDLGEDTEAKLETEVWGYAHEGPVSEVAVDALSDTLLTVGRADKKVKYWKLRTRERLLNDDGKVKGARTIETPSEIVSMRLCKCSDLVAVICENFVLYVYDGQSGKLAREFSGHRGPITDVCFAGDGRRLVSSSMDGTLRTWDLVSGTCVDTLHCSDPPTSVIVAPQSAFLATTHVNNLAVVLWIDQSKYIPLDSIKKRDRLPTLERVVVDCDDASDTDVEMEEAMMEEDEDVTTCLEPGLITFSGKPASQWTVLSNLHAIRERNKPLAPPKKPENVPFFLPTKKGLTLEFDIDKVMEDDKNDETDGDDAILENSQFGKLVSLGHYDEATQLLDALQPSGVDVELRTLEGNKVLRGASNYFLDRLGKTEEFELTQARLSVFLDANGIELTKMDDGAHILEQLANAQDECWAMLRKRMEAVMSLAGHFSGQV